MGTVHPAEGTASEKALSLTAVPCGEHVEPHCSGEETEAPLSWRTPRGQTKAALTLQGQSVPGTGDAR